MKLKKLLKHNTNNIVEVVIRKGEEIVYCDSPKQLNENFLNFYPSIPLVKIVSNALIAVSYSTGSKSKAEVMLS